ncbi:MAG: DMT family transporter [Pseudomonadota bacterium]
MISATHWPAVFAGMFSGMIFGIYWIILRGLETYGFTGIQAVMVFNLVPTAFLLPFLVWRWRSYLPGRWRLHLGAFLFGLSYVMYAASFLYTEVVKVIALFYILPIWGFLFARIFIKEPITPIRWLSMAMAFSGLYILFAQNSGLPMPQNSGDYLALIAGVTWASASLVILTDKPDPVSYSLGFFFWSSLISVLFFLLVLPDGSTEFFSLNAVRSLPWWIIPVALLILIPAGFCAVYAPSKINPGVVGLLFMTEVSVGVVTAALLANEPFGIREITAVILISVGGLAEPFSNLRRKPVHRS